MVEERKKDLIKGVLLGALFGYIGNFAWGAWFYWGGGEHPEYLLDVIIGHSVFIITIVIVALIIFFKNEHKK